MVFDMYYKVFYLGGSLSLFFQRLDGPLERVADLVTLSDIVFRKQGFRRPLS